MKPLPRACLFRVCFAVLACFALAGGAWSSTSQAAQPQPQQVAQAQHARQEVIEVRILPLAEVFGEVVTLGEIAEMDGFDLDALARLAQVEVGAAPLPGRSVRINGNMLRSRLARAIKGLRYKIVMPEEARVIRGAQVVAADEISAVVLAQAKQDTVLEGDAELQQQLSARLSDVVVPKGQLEIQATLLGNHLVQGGSRIYRVTASVDGVEAWKANLRVRQKIFQSVVVAKRRIRRHQKIVRGDLTRVKKDISINRGDPYMVKFEKVVGRFARRPIGKNQPLHESLIDAPADVLEGGRVTVVFQAGPLLLRAPGVALIQGREGQFIPVKNLQSGKIVHGILQAGEIVKVN